MGILHWAYSGPVGVSVQNGKSVCGLQTNSPTATGEEINSSSSSLCAWGVGTSFKRRVLQANMEQTLMLVGALALKIDREEGLYLGFKKVVDFWKKTMLRAQFLLDLEYK